MYITQFGGYDMPTDQLELEEAHGASRRSSTNAMPGTGGSFDDYGTGPDPLAEDTISKAFIIQGSSADDCQDQVDDFIGQMMFSQQDRRHGARILVALLPDGTYRQTWAKCEEARARWEYFHVNQGWVPVQCTFRRSWPIWETYNDLVYVGDHLTLAEAAALGLDLGQNVTEQAVSATPTTWTITNGGKVRSFGGVMEIDGQITDPKIENLTNEHWWSWEGTLNSGDRLTFRLDRYNVRLNGVGNEWSDITLGNAGGQVAPMVLEPGANSMRITGSGTISCTVRYYWARGWV